MIGISNITTDYKWFFLQNVKFKVKLKNKKCDPSLSCCFCKSVNILQSVMYNVSATVRDYIGDFRILFFSKLPKLVFLYYFKCKEVADNYNQITCDANLNLSKVCWIKNNVTDRYFWSVLNFNQYKNAKTTNFDKTSFGSFILIYPSITLCFV